MTANRDIENQLTVTPTLLPLSRTASVSTGSTVDLKGYTRAAFVAEVGTITDGTFTFCPQESADGTNWSAVAAADLGGSFTQRTSGSDETAEVVSYLGTGRYVRCGVTIATVTSGGTIGVSVIRMGSKVEPL